MHPKTYFIRLHQPFGALTGQPYLMYLHAKTPMEALLWVARVFEGIDVQTTLRKWQALAPATVRIGCSDPVTVHDCDGYRRHQRKGGMRVVLPAVEGEFRRSVEDVTHDLLKVFNHLQDERTRFARSFAAMKCSYEAGEAAWYFDRLEQLKASADKALVWQTNVWAEYLKTQQRQKLVMPERLALAA